MGLKKWLINYGVDHLLDKAIGLLYDNKQFVITYLENLAIKAIRPQDIPGIDGKDEQDIKDKEVLLIRMVVKAMINALLMRSLIIKDDLVKHIKV